MNKSTKGAVAAAAAGVLLLGGAGTLAYWTDADIIDGLTINSGHFKMDGADCDAATWTLDGGDPYTDQLLVPGDTVTKECDVIMDIAGEHLTHADFEVERGVVLDEELQDQVLVTFSVNGSNTDVNNVPVTDGQVIPVAITVEWPWDADGNGEANNVSNVVGGFQAVLNDITLTATQEHLEEDNN
jgi:alternate signal-mediated exported protein